MLKENGRKPGLFTPAKKERQKYEPQEEKQKTELKAKAGISC